jgi:hypothetical protein
MALTAKEALDAACIQVRKVLVKHKQVDRLTPECELHIAKDLADYIYSMSLYEEEAREATKIIDMAKKVLSSIKN